MKQLETSNHAGSENLKDETRFAEKTVNPKVEELFLLGALFTFMLPQSVKPSTFQIR
jgi:hypothetical protein